MCYICIWTCWLRSFPLICDKTNSNCDPLMLRNVHTQRARNVPTSDLGASRWCRSAHHKISIFLKAVALRALGWLLYSNLWLLLPGVDPVCLSWVFRQKLERLGNCLFSASSLRRDSPCALHSKVGTSTLGNKLLVTSYYYLVTGGGGLTQETLIFEEKSMKEMPQHGE